VPIFDQRTARVLATVLLFAAVGAFLWGARHTVIAFLFAIFFAYLLDPLVNLIERTRLGRGSRGRSILIVYLALFCVLGTLFYLTGPKLVKEAQSLSQSLPGLLEQVQNGEIAHQIGRQRGWSTSTQVRAEQLLSSHRDEIVGWARDFGGRAALVATNAIWLILIPILAIFFLRDGREFANSLVDTADRRSQKQLVRGILEDLHVMLAAYIRAQLILAAISLVVYTIVLTALRVPYAFVLGALGGMMEFIPVVGPLVAALSIIGVAFLTNYSHLLLVVVFLGAWRMIQDYVISPRVMGGRVELHPVAALFGILVGGEIAGVIGVYLSIPIIATLRILWRRWQGYEELQKEGPAVAGAGEYPRRIGSSS
jgi:predicted PurR-regulated permease PerM